MAVVVPCIDEAATLPLLLADLARQERIRLEVAVADGGSGDGTAEAAEAFGRRGGLPVHVVRTARGRGRQMNAGAAATSASELLFLHADTRVSDPGVLALAFERMARERAARGHHRVAGHFGLRFRRTAAKPSLGYYFYESKSFLSRAECVNGDQGLWLGRPYFEELGSFDEHGAFYEDAKLAARVFASGDWITLPGEISTSARRFETEGLRERQTVNALVRAFDALGHPAFFEEAAGLYRVHAEARGLNLVPFFLAAHRAVWAGGLRAGLERWRRAGTYVAAQAWQIAFWLDCRRNARRGLRPGRGPSPTLETFDSWAPRGNSCLLSAAAAALTMAWFYGSLGWHLLRKREAAPSARPPDRARDRAQANKR